MGAVKHRSMIMEISDIRRVGGCAAKTNVLGLLFNEVPEEDVIPVRLRTTCRWKWGKNCCIPTTVRGEDRGCPRYRIGTVGSHKISWDNRGARV